MTGAGASLSLSRDAQARRCGSAKSFPGTSQKVSGGQDKKPHRRRPLDFPPPRRRRSCIEEASEEAQRCYIEIEKRERIRARALTYRCSYYR